MKVLGSRMLKVCSWILSLQHSNCLSFSKPPSKLVSSSRKRGLIEVAPYRQLWGLNKIVHIKSLMQRLACVRPQQRLALPDIRLLRPRTWLCFCFQYPPRPPMTSGCYLLQLSGWPALKARVQSVVSESFLGGCIDPDTNYRVSVFCNSWLLNVISIELILSIGDSRIMFQHVSSH